MARVVRLVFLAEVLQACVTGTNDQASIIAPACVEAPVARIVLLYYALCQFILCLFDWLLSCLPSWWQRIYSMYPQGNQSRR